nr:DinB superfamily [uncultured bacterium]
MTDRKTDIFQHLDQTRQTVKGVLDHLQPADWETPIQDGDQHWSARAMLVHMVDAQRGMTNQLSKIAVGEDVIPPDFDLSRWNRRQVEKNADKTVPELLAALDEGRVTLKKAIEGLSDADLDKRGRHSSLEIMSVEQIARLIGTHEAEHAQIIARKLGL